MNAPVSPVPRRAGSGSDMRAGLVAAALMIALPLTAKLATRMGWAHADDFAERSLMAIIAGFIVFTGNTIPKRLVPRACATGDPSAVQAYLRFAGWTWVLAGLAFGIACEALPREASLTATFIILPTAIVLVGAAWFRMTRSRAGA